jgi:putative transposase
MPRRARIEAPGALQHLIIRGIEWREIFRSDHDRLNFVNRLSELVPETKTDCFAWAIQENQAHFLFRTGSLRGVGPRQVSDIAWDTAKIAPSNGPIMAF